MANSFFNSMDIVQLYSLILYVKKKKGLCAVNFKSAAAAKSCQSCPTLWDPIDGRPPGSHPWDSPGKNTGVG